MRHVFQLLERAAKSDVTVLLEGESGTGKDILATALHQESGRKEGPFIIVDCGAIPENLVESELFGHEKGAFTGAVASRPGAFEQADGGTVFLDEVGELPLDAQPKLLRALDGYEVRRVGAAGAGQRADVRVVAATHARLEQRVTSGHFRRDLFHRLECLVVSVPALRERRGDIGAIARELLQQLAPVVGVRSLTPAAIARLTSHEWPGNVRELRNVLCRAADATGTGSRIDVEDVDRAMRREPLALAKCITRQRAQELFRENAGNLSAAARAAGLPRTSFRKLLRA
jgi:DNA-binding NtrC family response regulator